MNRGYTIVEMLVAVVVTAIGFAAVFALQISTMQGNIAAREYAGATNLAERYMESLRSEAEMWQVGNPPPAPVLSRTDDRWHTLTPDPVDHNGQVNAADTGDPGSGLDRQRYCVHYRLRPLAGVYGSLMEAQVRVIWTRASLGQVNLDTVCPEGQANGFAPDVATWTVLTLPGMLTAAPAPAGA